MDIGDDPLLWPLIEKLGLDDEWLDTPNGRVREDGLPVSPRYAATRGCPACRYTVLGVLEDMAGERSYPRLSDMVGNG